MHHEIVMVEGLQTLMIGFSQNDFCKPILGQDILRLDYRFKTLQFFSAYFISNNKKPSNKQMLKGFLK